MNSWELPEPIIHLIQSSFSPTEAVRTTLVSKSWRSAWSTRPTIDLDESYFPHRCPVYSDYLDPLMVFADKTFQRYEESNLTIHTFRLRLKSEWYGRSGFAAKWISKALKLGASDITIRFWYEENIPIDEVLVSENVVALRLERLSIDRPIKSTKCSGLKSLALTELYVSMDLFLNIISCCPLIEKLSLTSCPYGFRPRACVRSDGDLTMIKLTSLELFLVESDQFQALFLADVGSKFPILRELTITFSKSVFLEAYKIETISSLSLEILNFRVIGGRENDRGEYDFQRVELDLPSIRKFTFEGEWMPNLCFSPRPARDQWDSHVSISHKDQDLSTTWFRELCKFLTRLRGSKIHLVLRLYYPNISSAWSVKIKGLNARKVEDLTIYTEGFWSPILTSLLDVLFRVCRPKMITHYTDPSYIDNHHWWDDTVDEKSRNNDLWLCRALEQGLKLLKSSSSMQSKFIYGFHDLEEVNAQELQGEVWMPQPMDSILGIDSADERRFFRFQLKWKS